jgi:hypothetical protein
MLLSKGMKSLQLSLNEFIPKLNTEQLSITNMTYSKARRKLKHTAFIELNQAAVVDTMYSDGDYQTLHGFRILAVDGSKVLLPGNNYTEAEFGVVPFNHAPSNTTGNRCYGRASVLYDVLNRVAIDAQLEPVARHEVDILIEHHLPSVQSTDLVVYDRGYASYRALAHMFASPGEFLVRCPGTFAQAKRMMSGKGPGDVVAKLQPSGIALRQAEKHNEQLPDSLTVRFVRVTLNTGEYEILITSLIDQELYPHSIFKELYWLRWRVETFYGVLKTRLGLENFSGYSPEAIRQDFFAAVFLTGIETLFAEDAEQHLSKQVGLHAKKVNKAVSFNAIKHRAFELFYSQDPIDTVLEELTTLFTTSPTLIRPDKHPPRGTNSPQQKLNHWRRKRKSVF